MYVCVYIYIYVYTYMVRARFRLAQGLRVNTTLQDLLSCPLRIAVRLVSRCGAQPNRLLTRCCLRSSLTARSKDIAFPFTDCGFGAIGI